VVDNDLLTHYVCNSAAVVAEDDGTELYEAKMTDVERLFDEDAELSVAFYRIIARRLGARLRDLPLPRPCTAAVLPGYFFLCRYICVSLYTVHTKLTRT
jgi:hypothetical protein